MIFDRETNEVPDYLVANGKLEDITILFEGQKDG